MTHGIRGEHTNAEYCNIAFCDLGSSRLKLETRISLKELAEDY